MRVSIYNASAGSGKTYQLAYKYVHDVIKSPELYREILAVTFTNKATEEMKHRILKQINILATDSSKSDYLEALMRDIPNLSASQIEYRAKRAQSLILHNYSRFTVLTIDTFFQRILRAFIQELGLDVGYSLEIESSSIISRSVDSLIEDITTTPELRKWLMGFVQERINDGAKWDVRDAILSLSTKLFDAEARKAIERAPDKETLQKIINNATAEAENESVKLVDIAKRAQALVGEGGFDRFKYGKSSGGQIFNKVANGELPKIGKRVEGCAESDDAWCDTKSPLRGVVPELRQLLNELLDQYDSVIESTNTTKLIRENYRSFALLTDLYAKSESICREQNTMLLNQTAQFISEIISEDNAPFIYEKVGNRFSRFMIDEFQDTSRVEWNNFLPLLHNAMSQSEEDENPILIVGDIKQSIYRWRGGDWRMLHSQARESLGRDEVEVINMNTNYRSLPNVVKFNNQMIASVVESLNRELMESLNSAKAEERIKSETYNDLDNMLQKAYETQEQIPRANSASEGFVEVLTYPEEPPVIAQICAAIDRGFSPSDIMILTRSNPEASRIAEILLNFKQSNPPAKYTFDVMTQQALAIGYAPVSNFIMSILRLALNPNDLLQRAIYNQFLQKDRPDVELSDSERELLLKIRVHSPIEAFEMIVMEYKLEHDKSNIAYLQAIQEQILNFCNNRIGDISLWLEWWEETGAAKSLSVDKNERAIEILTIHKAKGLEKRVVIIPYCNWDLEPRSSGKIKNYIWAQQSGEEGESPTFPIIYKRDMERSAFVDSFFRERVYSYIDNVNLLYVALTRAVESLHILVRVNPNRRKRDIGEFVLGGCCANTNMTFIEGENPCYQFGEPAMAQDVKRGGQATSRHINMDRYGSTPPNLTLRMPTKRYREDAEYAPREVGIYMHKAFELAKSREDIFENIDSMLKGGHIDDAEQQSLRSAVELSLRDPRAAEWFDNDWDMVRNECEIILPNRAENRRPDRVMIQGARCVVVDYKFGTLHSAKYKRQMSEYVNIMREMGYTQVEGYIWYIRNNAIEAV